MDSRHLDPQLRSKLNEYADDGIPIPPFGNGEVGRAA